MWVPGWVSSGRSAGSGFAHEEDILLSCPTWRRRPRQSVDVTGAVCDAELQRRVVASLQSMCDLLAAVPVPLLQQACLLLEGVFASSIAAEAASNQCVLFELWSPTRLRPTVTQPDIWCQRFEKSRFFFRRRSRPGVSSRCRDSSPVRGRGLWSCRVCDCCASPDNRCAFCVWELWPLCFVSLPPPPPPTTTSCSFEIEFEFV